MALLRALELIKKGTFASKGLPKSINDFFIASAKLLKEPAKFVDQLFIDVLDRYNLSSNAEDEKNRPNTQTGIVNPKIVLTQSFT